MSESLPVVFYTVPPSVVLFSYQEPPYRNVIGISSGGSELWTPDAAPNYQSEEHILPEDLVRRLMAFFKHKFVMFPKGSRDCHIAAAALTGFSRWNYGPDAVQNALMIMRQQQRGPRKLEVGKQGVYGASNLPCHSVVSLGSNNEYIQVDGTGGKLSILTGELNDEFHIDDVVDFYSPK